MYLASLHTFMWSFSIYVDPTLTVSRRDLPKAQATYADMSGPPTLPLGHDARLAREEAEWMIQDMGWIPTDFSAQGTTALMRARFSEAVAAFSLQAQVQSAEGRRHTVQAPIPEANAAQEEVEIRSHSSTELSASDTQVCELSEPERYVERISSTSPWQTRLVRIAARKKKTVEARLVRTLRISPTAKG